jgi:hypothetical protein
LLDEKIDNCRYDPAGCYGVSSVREHPYTWIGVTRDYNINTPGSRDRQACQSIKAEYTKYGDVRYFDSRRDPVPHFLLVPRAAACD